MFVENKIIKCDVLNYTVDYEIDDDQINLLYVYDNDAEMKIDLFGCYQWIEKFLIEAIEKELQVDKEIDTLETMLSMLPNKSRARYALL